MNTFGRLFRATTWGESHGRAVGCVVDGCPSGLELTLEEIQKELDRRRPGQSDITTERSEADTVELLSGVFEDKTLGTPISMLIGNEDADSSNYLAIKDTPRPGHGDFTWREKFKYVDWRGGGRASARETVGRVAAGAVAKKLLETQGIEVMAFTREIGGIRSEEELDPTIKGLKEIIDSNPVRAIDMKMAKEIEDIIKVAKAQGDSVGGVIEAVALGVPTGLGEPVFGRLDAELAKAVMSIPAVKGVEIGEGFELAKMRGSEANDEFVAEGDKIKLKTNRCGGILGGISTGMPIVLRAAIKPTSSIATEQDTIDLETRAKTKIKVEGRHDPCIVPRAVPIIEAMLALVLADHGLISGKIPRVLD